MLKMFKKLMALLLVIMLLPQGMYVNAEKLTELSKKFQDDAGYYEISIKASSEWNNGYIAEVTVTNLGDKKIRNWNVQANVPGDVLNVWNAEPSNKGEKYQFHYQTHNREIAVDSSISFGMEVHNASLKEAEIVGLTTGKREDTKDYEISYKVQTTWNDYAIIEATVHNKGKKNLRDWKMKFQFDGEIENIWNADMMLHEDDQYVIKNRDYNADIMRSESITFGFQARYPKSKVGSFPTDEVLYAIPEKVKINVEEEPDWNKSMVNADDEAVEQAKNNAKDKIKIAVLDSGVDYCEAIDVAERKNFVDEYEETNPLFDDLSGHGTSVAGIISAGVTPEVEEEEIEEENSFDFDFLEDSDQLEEDNTPDEEEEESDETSDEDDEMDDEEFDDEDETEDDGEGEDSEEEDIDEEEVDPNESFFAKNVQFGTIEGMNENAEIYSGRVLDSSNSASVDTVIKGIEWAIEKDVKIINLSWGTETDSEALHNAIIKAYKKGILIIAAAGNEESIMYPAKYDEVMAVGAVNTNCESLEGSATGEGLEVVAPGEMVTAYTSFGILDNVSGSSIAAPQVTALASILWQLDITKSNEFIRQLINITANNLGDANTYGNGIIDYEKAVSYYSTFAEIFSQTQTLQENEAEAMLLESMPEEQEEIAVVDDAYVEGLWYGTDHKEIVGTENDNLKAGTTWPDNKNSNISGMKDHPQFHGFKDENYVDAYIYLTKQAKYYSINGKWDIPAKEDKRTKRDKLFINSLKNCLTTGAYLADRTITVDKQDGTKETMTVKCVIKSDGNYEVYDSKIHDKYLRVNSTKNDKTKRYNAYFVYGMALHTMEDVFSHSSWGIDLQTKNDYNKCIKVNAWKKIKHGDKDEKGEFINNRADNTNVVPQRYAYAEYIAQRVIKNKIPPIDKGSFKEGKATDFIANKNTIKANSCKLILKQCTNNTTKKRMEYIYNHFGITKLKKYIKNSLGTNEKLTKKQINRLKCLDNAQIKKQFKSWRSAKVNIKNIAGMTENCKFEVYKVTETNGKTKYIKVNGIKKTQENTINNLPYVFIGDEQQKYILRFYIEKETGTDKPAKQYITQWVNLGKNKSENKDKNLFDFKKFTVDFNTLNPDVKVVVKNSKEIKNAKVIIQDYNDDTYAFQKTTDKNGSVVFNNIPVGIYKLQIEKKGYKTTKGKLVVKRKYKEENGKEVLQAVQTTIKLEKNK